MSSEFRGTPREEGKVEMCLIGEADEVQFLEPGVETEKKSEIDEQGEDEEEEESSGEEDDDEQEWVMSSERIDPA